MEEYLVDFAGGSERGNAHQQPSDDFSDIEVSFNLLDQGDKQSLDYITHALNGEDSSGMVQLGTLCPQATPATKNSIPNQSAWKSTVERKRAKDKAYRERLKKGKIEMKSNMETLTEENMLLKNENGALKGENTHMNQVLQSQAKEIDQLKNDLNRLKHEYKKQNALVQTLSDILVNSDLRKENQKLQNENDLLRRNMGMDSQRLQLMEENLKLKHEIKVLKVQVDALCEKLIIDNSKNHEQAQADMI
ncbi:hypothetical protein SLEP1_g52749 [Rubroshorea leprosula]|uniref:BZIP domain-containing protein n=1 Tax=Rubroshorea leprosula TaxID=152421 RepID=A0AAV5M7D6_9ROSI|nr:hypothetical protein SLEP1_g52749 [Rubroshorea leprosula]